MYELKCGMCGAPIFAEKQHDIRRFCSKKCYGAFLHLKKCEIEQLQNEPDMQKLKDVSDEGYIFLISAIVDQASWDVLHSKPDSYRRIDAENFFLSDYFDMLTGLNGWAVLDKLLDQYEAQHRKKGAKA